MEVVPLVGGGGGGGAGGGTLPFAHRDVQEWSRLDRLTGTLEHARVETDRWAAKSATASHQYGKRVDNRTRELAGGGGKERTSSQVEVFESRERRGGTGPAVHVVRKQTLTTTSSSSTVFRSATATLNGNSAISPSLPDFDQLQLTLNPLDVSSEKSRGSVGRSGSIGGRRPPSRPRSLAILPDEASLENSLSLEDLENQNNETNKNSKIANGDDVAYKPRVRRSLQFSPIENSSSPFEENLNQEDELPPKGSVNKVRRALEERRLEALESVLRRGASIADSVKLDDLGDGDENSSLAALLAKPRPTSSTTSPKRHSFVTVESLKEVREKLRRTSGGTDTEDDAGIVVSDPAPRVRSYIYGMTQGTGSLESRTSNRSSSSGGSRSEEWYNRRKSYGFEKVHGAPSNETTSLKTDQEEKSSMFYKKPQREASTDSGICRSTEHVGNSANENKIEEIRRHLGLKTPNSNNSCVQIKPGGTVVTLGPQPSSMANPGTVVTIPIVAEDDTSVAVAMRGKVDTRRLFFQQLAQDTSLSVETTNKINNSEVKRHSIAVDESKYVEYTEGQSKNISNDPGVHTRRHSNLFEIGALENIINGGNWSEDAARKKRVEFCKTEVHFAAESGRFNLVETDEKPPPTNMFRRRRRNAAAAAAAAAATEAMNSGLPELRFGDLHYEKELLSAPSSNEMEQNEPKESTSPSQKSTRSSPTLINIVAEDEEYLTDDKPRGILKSRPKLLLLPVNRDENRWGGVKLRHVQDGTWRSPVAGTARVQEQSQPAPEHITKTRSASWSVADRVRHVEQLTSTKITSPPYSTKVHIGDSTTAVESNLHQSPTTGHTGGRLYHSYDKNNPIWQRREEFHKENNPTKISDTNHNPTKSLIVRIGKSEEQPSSSNQTKTTKITIGLTPSPPSCIESTPSCLQSPSLILQTFKSARTSSISSEERGCSEELVVGSTVLAAWKERYYQHDEDDEDLRDDSADEEVRSYMSGGGGSNYSEESRSGSDGDAEGSTVISGSWNRVMATEIARDYRRNITQDSTNKLEAADTTKGVQNHRSVKTAMVSSYNDPNDSITGSRLRSVETLVSTSYGRPKITSISLRYDDDNYLNDSNQVKTSANNKYISKENKHNIEIPINGSLKKYQTDVKQEQTKDDFYKANSQSSLMDWNKSPKESPNSSLTKKNNERYYTKNKVVSSLDKRNEDYTLKNYEKEEANNKNKLGSNKNYVLSSIDTYSNSNSKQENKLKSEEKKQTYCKKYYEDTKINSNKYISLNNMDKRCSDTTNYNSRNYPSRTFIDGSPGASSLDFSKRLNSKNINENSKNETKGEPFERKTYRNSPNLLKKEEDLQVKQTENVISEKIHLDMKEPIRDENVKQGLYKNKESNKFQKETDCNTNISSTKNLSVDSKKIINKQILVSKSKSETSNKKIDYDGGSNKPTGDKTLQTRKPIDSSTFVRRKSKTSSSPSPINSGTFTRRRGKEIDSRTLPVHRSSIQREQVKDEEKIVPLYVNGHVSATSSNHIYENQDMLYRSRENDTESAIMEELTRAADEILKAVNGYTDEESFRASASSDEEQSRRHGNKPRPGPLATINESPSVKSEIKSSTITKRSSNSRTTCLSLARQSRNGGASSTSSLESIQGTTSNNTPSRKNTTVSSNGTKSISSRAARLIQRANSRELLLGAHASSSEDVPTDTAAVKASTAAAASAQLRRQRANARRSRNGNSTSTTTNITTQSRLQVGETRMKERASQTNYSTSRREVGNTNRPRPVEIKHSEAKHMIMKVSEKTGLGNASPRHTSSSSSRRSNGSLKSRESSSLNRARTKKTVPFK